MSQDFGISSLIKTFKGTGLFVCGVIKTLAEDSTLNIDNILNAIRDEAHHLLKVKASAGKEVYDITPDIADALKDYIDFKHSGVSDIDAFLAQQDMFANRPSLTASIMREFFAKKASQQQIADTLREYAKLAMLQDNDTPALFETEVAPRERLWELAVNKATGERYSIEAGVSSTPSAEEVAEAKRQYDEVVARYTNPDGTKKPGWMKAPNGKKTNLTERQWVQVRTHSFKRWFGDWKVLAEANRVYRFLMNTASVASITGNEFPKDGVKLTDKIPAFFKEKYNGVAFNEELGEIKLDIEGVKDDIAHGVGRLKVAAYAAVHDVIEKGIVYNRSENWKGRGWKTAVIGAPIKIGGADYICEVVIKQLPNRRGFYLHEVEVKENVEDTFKTSTKGGVSPTSKLIIAKLLNESKSVSKVVDENGEPLVVYRGDNKNHTKYEWANVFHATNEDTAATYGEVVQSNFINARNPLIVDTDGAEWLSIDTPSELKSRFEDGEEMDDGRGFTISFDEMSMSVRDMAMFAKKAGYDALIVKNVQDSNEGEEIITDDIVTFSPTQIKSATDNIGTYSQRSDIRWSIAPAEVSARLDAEPTIKVYRAMQIVDGKLYSPMAAKINGVWTDEQGMGKWLQADEHPELITPDGKFKLDKGNGTSVEAAYNPYWHTSNSPFNDQFSSAYLRPNLVVVEVEIPQSELCGKYWAKGAKDPVGPIANWHKGKTTAEIEKATGQKREVILSRWCKINRIVPVNEVADIVTGMVKDAGIVIDSNTITPALRSELTKRGVKINEVHPAAGEVKKAIANAIKNQTIANNISTKEQKVVVDAAMKFFNEFKAKRIPLSTGGEMFFAPSPEALERYGYDAVAAWAEYAIHQVTSDGGRKRTFAREKINQILPQIETIIAEDNVFITKRRGVERFIFQKLLDNKHIARIVATPVMNGLVVDLAEVTSVYMSKGNTTSMPLSRAIEEWKSSRGLYLTSSTTLSKPQPSDDVKQYSITAEEDRAYLDAVRRGDMETAQRMVREAAVRNGYSVQEFYHATNKTKKPFYIFDPLKGRQRDWKDAVRTPIFFADNTDFPMWFRETMAWIEKDKKRREKNTQQGKPTYGVTADLTDAELAKVKKNTRMINAFLRMQKTFDSTDPDSLQRLIKEADLSTKEISFLKESISSGMNNWEIMEGEAVQQWLKDNGYDSYIGVEEGNKTIGVYDSSQIKSADPVTYDDAGNVIPLSERFNPEKDDVRYSITMAPPPPNVSYILPTQNRADEIRVVDDEVAQKAMQGKNGLRPDGTRKGLGFFGALATRSGGIMTEFSVGFTYDGKNVDVPTLNPLLTRDEISYLLRGYIFEDDATWKNILDKTARWGAQRLKEGKSPFIEDGEPRTPIPQSNDIRFSIRVNDDLADLDKFNAFKSAMAIEQPMPEGVNLLPEGVSPFEALRYFEENILGKTIRMPDGETLTLDIGHFFRLVCDGSHGKKGYVEGFDSSKSALAAIRKNEVLPEKINGYQSDRARMLPVFLDTVEHPVIEMQEKNEPSKTQFVKRYDVDGGRGVVAAFRYIKDGKKIQSFHGFSTRYGKVKKYRITYVDDAAIRGAYPDAPELTIQQAMYNVPQSAPTVNGAPQMSTPVRALKPM